MNVNTDRPVIALDIGGVIIPYLDDVIDDHIKGKLSVDDEAFQRLWLKHVPFLVTGKISEATFWNLIEADLGRSVGYRSLLMEKYVEHLDINTPLLKALEGLKQQFDLAVFSNSINPHSEHNRNMGIYDVFDHIFLSDEIGFMKPDSEFYTYAIDVLGVTPDQIIFFDDKQENVDSARSIGIQAHRYVSNEALLRHFQY